MSGECVCMCVAVHAYVCVGQIHLGCFRSCHLCFEMLGPGRF